MRIAIDARAYGWTGIGRYIRNLLSGLEQQHAHQIIALMGRRDARSYRGAHDVAIVDDAYYSFREQTLFRWQLSRVHADLFHFTHFNAPVAWRCPYVVTVHDTTRFIFPGERHQGWLQQVAYEYIFARVVARACGIITVSNATRLELGRLPLTVPDQAVIIYEGVDAMFKAAVSASDRQRVRRLIGTVKPYVLYVGVWMGHKNLERCLAAFAALRRRDIRLVLAGASRPGYHRVTDVVKKLKISDRVIFTGFIPDQAMPALYAEAEVLIVPSLCEGFGLPAIEAAAAGTPVIASNVSSLPEIMAGAALFVNPEYTSGLSAALERSLTDAGLRMRLKAAGRARAAQLNWADCVSRHVRFYEQICSLTSSR